MPDNKDYETVAVSTRVRLARNLKDYPFMGRINDKQMQEIREKAKNALISANSKVKTDFNFIDMEKLSDYEAAALVEEHLISPEFAAERKNRELIVSKDKEMSIMINEEDHIRIQSIKKGLNLNESLKQADRMDDLFDEKLDYAFDERLGFLTHCPTNLGTGMRASVMLHLPALSSAKTIGKIVNAVTKFGLTVRGLYGEGSEAEGSLYQISNQVTLGISEGETIDKLKDIVLQIISQENNARELLLKNNRIELEDRIFRAYGILTGARLLSSAEFLKYYSVLRLGCSMDIIKNIQAEKLDELFVKAGAANISVRQGRELSAAERDFARAALVREAFSR